MIPYSGGQKSLACFGAWGRKELDTTHRQQHGILVSRVQHSDLIFLCVILLIKLL